MRLPRLVVAAPASGQGKTTLAVGLMAALTADGHRVAPAKVGPDYIDPGFHALATGRPSRTLDPWLCGERLLGPLLAHGARTPEPADLAVVEGVMGLHDGRLGTDGEASTAHVARVTASPVLLVVDVSGAARTVAAVVQGLARYDDRVRVAGVVLNRAGSGRHAAEARRAVEGTGVPVLGVLPRDEELALPSRHLGLVTAAELPGARTALDRLAEQVAAGVDLAAVREVAAQAPPLRADPWDARAAIAGAGDGGHDPLPGPPPDDAPVVAVAGGRAFTFRYPETAELLAAAGCQVVEVDPEHDASLPAGTAGLYLGGGFPQVHAAALGANAALRAEVAAAVAAGIPTVAECAGMLYLARTLDGHPMAAALPAGARMTRRLRLGYREAALAADGVLGPAGTVVRGHEFHRTEVDPAHGQPPAWTWDGRPHGFALDPAGTGHATVHASYLHTHWAGAPALAASFAGAVRQAAAGHTPPHPAHPARPSVAAVAAGGPVTAGPRRADSAPAPGPTGVSVPVEPDLHHHGDAEVGPGLLDLAVNVRGSRPPAWLADRLRACVDDLAAYPDPGPAREALAARHGVPPEAVLPTAGGAEAFTLLARALPAERPVVVHPQFTEPEAALLAAGRVPARHLLREGEGFALDPGRLAAEHADADLVLVGNPTNPTGVRHDAAVLQRLRRPGRVLVVDEAFMDVVPGEAGSLLASDGAAPPDLGGLLVLRSLTKTWAIAGLRAGYVVGDPALLRRLAAVQPPWSVATPAAVAMRATAEAAALAEAARAARELARWRAHLVAGLRGLGLSPVPGEAPFVLVRVGHGVRERLRERGIAVRRGDTFPGLDGSWVRLAVRAPATSDRLLAALERVLEREPAEPGRPA